jgi:hypothetical protein
MIELRRTVQAKDVLLVGSAPGALYCPGKLLICVNASSLGIDAPTPDVTFFNTFSLVLRTPTAIATRPLLNRLKTKLLIVIDAAERGDEAPVAYDCKVSLGRAERRAFLEAAMGITLTGDAGNHVPSTGYFAAIALVMAGVRSLEMTGFSFSGGQSYLVGDTPRMHVDMDRAVLRWLGTKERGARHLGQDGEPQAQPTSA